MVDALSLEVLGCQDGLELQRGEETGQEGDLGELSPTVGSTVGGSGVEKGLIGVRGEALGFRVEVEVGVRVGTELGVSVEDTG